MGGDEDVKKMVEDWFDGMTVDSYNVGILKLVT
jgi:hypothetical protein